MAQSNLVKIRYGISAENFDIVKQNNYLIEALQEIEKIYSYVILSEYKDHTISGWSILINIHENEVYNTILTKDAIHNMLSCIELNLQQTKNGKCAIGFGQPPLEVMLEIYKPYIQSAALKMQRKWQMYELDDLISICNMCMCILYNAGYYLNKSLLQKSFTNYVLMDLRKNRNAPQFVSMDSLNEEGLSIKDTLADTLIDEQQYDEEADAIRRSILDEEKKEVINIIGERAYNELLRIYRNNVTDTYSCKQINTIRNKLEKAGINYNTIKTKMIGD